MNVSARGVRKLVVGFNRCFRGPEVCRYVEASTRPRENLLHVHTPLVRTKRARIFLLSISRGSQRLSRKSVPQQRVSLPPPFLLSCRFPFIRLHARVLPFPLVAHSQMCALSHIVGRKQISGGDLRRNVSQLISRWRNMMVIKREFSLYGTHSKTSGTAQSSNGEAAVREYFTLRAPLRLRSSVSSNYNVSRAIRVCTFNDKCH